MKKTLMFLVMAAIVVLYIMMSKSNFAKKNEEVVPDTQEVLLKEIPQKAEDVLNEHNRLMKRLYSSQTQIDQIPGFVEAMRKLYSKELLALNTQEDQVLVLASEFQTNKEKGVYLIETKIEYIKYNNQEDNAQALVVYKTTKGDQTKSYDLVLEEGYFKIYAWENIQSINAAEEKVE